MPHATFTARALSVAVGVTLAVAAVSVMADDEPEAAPEAQGFALPRPTSQHRLLRQDVGVWDAVVKTWKAPGEEPEVAKGVERNRMLPGGLWLVTDFRSELGGVPFVGHGQYGYDVAKGKYVGTWIDSLTTSILSEEGDYDEALDALVMEGPAVDPTTGQTYMTRGEYHNNDDGTRVYTMYVKPHAGEGEPFKVMEITYTRRADDEPKKADTPAKAESPRPDRDEN